MNQYSDFIEVPIHIGDTVWFLIKKRNSKKTTENIIDKKTHKILIGIVTDIKTRFFLIKVTNISIENNNKIISYETYNVLRKDIIHKQMNLF